MSKRRRTQSGFSTKRPIDKSLIFVEDDALTVRQTITTLIAPPSACTMVGLRWVIASVKDTGTSGIISNFTWAIVLVRDGNSANALSITNGNEFYQPEQNVLAFGVAPSTNDTNQSLLQEGNTKTMRKLLIRDSIVFIAKGQNTETTSYRGIIQIFCKS